MEINKIYNCDAILGLEKLYKEHGEICDAIITDPPYNISKKNNFNTMDRQSLDFGDWDKEFDIISWIKPSLKVLKKGGNIIIFNDWRNLGLICDELEKNGCLIKDVLIWNKTNPMPRNTNRRYVPSFEFAIWATKGSGWTFNKGEISYRKGIFLYPVVHSKYRKHPTQKNKELICEIIKIHTNKKDLVCDPFMGSGTTAFACIDTDRKFIGFELENTYYNSFLTEFENLNI